MDDDFEPPLLDQLVLEVVVVETDLADAVPVEVEDRDLAPSDVASVFLRGVPGVQRDRACPPSVR